MNARRAFSTAILCAGMPVFAHRLDEYLQATIMSVEKDRVQAQICLTPGVAVFPTVLAAIDTDRDGVISEAEQRAYAGRVLRDLLVTIDGDPLKPRLTSLQFPTIEEMKEGRGEIQIEFNADLPPNGPNRKLIFENHHQSQIAAYQVNCLVPRDPDIRILAQNRNYSQSHYELDYAQAGVRSIRDWLGTVAVLLFVWLALWWSRKREKITNKSTPLHNMN